MPARTGAQVPRVLVTGFEPFAGHESNPSAEIARLLDGQVIAGRRVAGRVLPVDFRRLRGAVRGTIKELGRNPVAVVSLGLAGGEAAIRLERVAVNLAAFEIPDNAGRRVRDQRVSADGPDAFVSRLPLARIRAALWKAGIPARLSNSAGTYLCNAAMYAFLETTGSTVPCGFIHLPATPAEVARAQARGQLGEGESSASELASMALETMVEAVRISLRVTLAPSASRSSPRA